MNEIDYDLPEYDATQEKHILWRLWHGINYMLGGILFFFGSLQYYPSFYQFHNGAVIGGWLFTIGSTNFLLADLTEWNNFRFGCLGSKKYQKNETDINEKIKLVEHNQMIEMSINNNNIVYQNTQSSSNSIKIDQKFSCKRIYKRAEMGINFFCSVIGSTLYLLGSIFFIPSTNQIILGEWLFIIGSLIIFFSQLWKNYRTAATNETVKEYNYFRIKNILQDAPGFCVDLFAGLGGLMYAIGTWKFRFAITLQDQIIPTNFFMAGGTFFTLSGLSMQYRYYIWKKIC